MNRLFQKPVKCTFLNFRKTKKNLLSFVLMVICALKKSE